MMIKAPDEMTFDHLRQLWLSIRRLRFVMKYNIFTPVQSRGGGHPPISFLRLIE